MRPIVQRIHNKTYLRIPGGELQFGHLTHQVTVWFLGRRYTLWQGRDPFLLRKGQKVWYDDAPGVVIRDGHGRTLVRWTQTGHTSQVWRSDLLTDASYHALQAELTED